MELINKNIGCFEYLGMLALFVFPPFPFSLFFLVSSVILPSFVVLFSDTVYAEIPRFPLFSSLLTTPNQIL